MESPVVTLTAKCNAAWSRNDSGSKACRAEVVSLGMTTPNHRRAPPAAV